MKKVKIILFAVIFLFLGIIIEKINNTEVNALDSDKVTIKKDKNMLSMMLETEANSGNYELTTRESWPSEGYVFNTELSKCEHGSELSWDDTNKRVLMSGNVSDKCYVYFDVYVPPRFDEICDSTTLACHVAKLYTGTQGDNGIYYHDKSLSNGAEDNSYRFAGASNQVNNYVCFGSTQSTCPEDNLYRIIGVFGDKTKLIRSNPVERYIDTSHFIWSTSDLNAYLNNEFINTFDELTKGKIAETAWKVGENSDGTITNQPAKIAYQNEVINPSQSEYSPEAVVYSARIGIMYVSDYGFAAAPSAWTTTLKNYNTDVITSVNWMYMGVAEWAISKGADKNCLFCVYTNGRVYCATEIGSGKRVRPVFNLLSSVTYVSGSGTSSDPIRIGD